MRCQGLGEAGAQVEAKATWEGFLEQLVAGSQRTAPTTGEGQGKYVPQGAGALSRQVSHGHGGNGDTEQWSQSPGGLQRHPGSR